MLKISFDLNHPAHFHLFKNVLSKHEKLGFEPLIFFQEKDKLRSLLKNEGYIRALRRYNKGDSLSRIIMVPKDIIQMRKILREEKVLANFGKMSTIGTWAIRSLNKRSIVFDDSENAKAQLSFYKYLASEVWTPNGFPYLFGKRQKYFNGIFPLAYLDPDVFQPDISIPKELGLLDRGKPILIRIINYQALHDWKYRHKEDDYLDIIKKLDRNYDLLISVEGGVWSKELLKYKIDFDPSNFLDILAYSKLYIGSGCSTAQEAAVLGIPSINTNPYAKGAVLDIIEQDYKFSKRITQKNLNIEKINKILSISDIDWRDLRKKMLDDFINVPMMIENLIKREINTFLNS